MIGTDEYYTSEAKPVVDKLSVFDACANNEPDVNDTDVVETESQWLPEVGEEYELKPYWHRVTITTYDTNGGDCHIVFWNHHEQSYDYRVNPEQFRPIKKADQIEQKKRDAIKDEIRGMLSYPTSNDEKVVDLVYEWHISMVTKSGVDISPVMKEKGDE